MVVLGEWWVVKSDFSVKLELQAEQKVFFTPCHPLFIDMIKIFGLRKCLAIIMRLICQALFQNWIDKANERLF